MSNTTNILIEQYENLRVERAKLTRECERLPVGSIQQKRIKDKYYYYRQFREGSIVRTIFVPNSQVDEMRRNIDRRKEIEKKLKMLQVELKQIIKALGADIHKIPDFNDYKPIRKVDYKDYTMYMSHLAHEVKRLGKSEFLIEYSDVKESGIRARYLRALIHFLSKEEASKKCKSSNIVLDPLTYQMYFTYGKKEVLEMRMKDAIPEFLMQGLLITDIQEAVGGTFD